MTMNKRDFLKLTGLALIGAGAAPGLEAAAGEKKTGRRWAMVIDLTQDVDWAPVIKACHRAHNVPDFVHNRADSRVNDIRHEIKWLWTERYANSFEVEHDEEQYVSERLREMKLPVLCNHCDSPPCVRACPTKATFKRPDGIVIMDYHRCIGCRFCMAACPYGSRSFNFKDPRLGFKDPGGEGGWSVPNPDFPTRMKGVVEKCNFCAERIAVGRRPACVDACSEGALAFGDLNDPGLHGFDDVAKILRESFTIKRKPNLGTVPMVYYIV